MLVQYVQLLLCLSVRPSVRSRSSVKTAKHIITRKKHRTVSHERWVSPIKGFGEMSGGVVLKGGHPKGGHIHMP